MIFRMLGASIALLAGQAHAQPAGDDPFVLSLIEGGMSESDALEWTATLNEASALDATLRNEQSNRYAGIYVDDVQRRVVVKLTGGADNLLSRYTTNQDIVAERAQFSLAQLGRKQDRIAQALGRETTFVLTIDTRGNQVRVNGKRGQDAPGKLRRAALIEGDVDIRETEEPWTPLAGTVGGLIRGRSYNTTTPANMSWRSNASLGFGVSYRDSSNVTRRGYVTAGHFDECKPSSGTVLSSSTPCVRNSPATEASSGATLTYVSQALGGENDVELRTTTSTTFSPSNVVRYGGGQYGYANYSITRVGTMASATPVCKQGFKTFYTCGTVTDPLALISNNEYGIYGRFAFVRPNSGTPDGLMANSGDSGGPVWGGGNTAYGLVQGGDLAPTTPQGQPNPTYGYMTVLPVSRLSAVGATILTSP